MQLLERASQLESLHSALREVAAGQGCVALVYGEAGIGKTSLVEQFAGQNDKSWRILTGACDLLFTPRPLGPLGDIAFQTKGRLLRLLQGGADRESLFAACLSELQSQPTILIIEDIHWADEATLDLLKYLGRRIRQTTCLMILTYRDDEIGADSPLRLLLGDLASSQAVRRVPVPALSVEGVQELARGRNLDAGALHRLTNGNPFFLTEVLAGGGGQGVPETVRDALLARAARLSPAARAALEAASIVGQHAEAWLLTSIDHRGEKGLEECIARGLLQAKGEAYAFRHELARKAILESISAKRKRELHRKVLAALRDAPQTHGDLARLASHAAGTDDAAAVLEYAPAAARLAAETGAHRQAAALYELALRFADALPLLEHVQLLEAYADECGFLGEMDIVIEARRQIIDGYHRLGDRSREGRNLALVAWHFHLIGQRTETEEAMNAALAILERVPPSDELAQAYCTQCYLLSRQLEFARSVAFGQKAIALAERFEDADVISRAGNLTGQMLLLIGDERGRPILERSLAVARESGLHSAVGMTLINWANAFWGNFEIAKAAALLEEGIAYATRHDDDLHLSRMRSTQAQLLLLQGRWAEAADLIRQITQQPQFKAMLTFEEAYILGRLGVRRGESNAVGLLTQGLTSCLDSNRLEPLGMLEGAVAEAAWLAGDTQSAIQELRAEYERNAREHLVGLTGELAFWRWRAGDVFTPPDWIARPYALQIAGDWRAAAKDWERRGCPYEQAMALMDGDEAAQLAALEIFERLGARPILEKLRQKMRAEGMHGIPRGPRPSTRENSFGLTPREREVLSCLTEGLSNLAIARRLSLSVRTVEHHIASILQKTGTCTRGELLALALREKIAVTR